MLKPNILRKKVLDLVYKKKSGHIGGSFSIAELICTLYNNYNIGETDKLILSKGHSVPIVYAALHELGLISDDDLDKFREIDSPLQGHPDKNRLKHLHATTGSLGQGLSISVGHALAKKHKKLDGTVFCILGDGEIQEGQVWEAFLSGCKFNLDNLVCFIDWNKAQSEGLASDVMPMYENLTEKISSFGWHSVLINGHNIYDIKSSIDNRVKDKPTCIVLDTVKGKGVSFMEEPKWHSKCPTEEEYNKATTELL